MTCSPWAAMISSFVKSIKCQEDSLAGWYRSGRIPAQDLGCDVRSTAWYITKYAGSSHQKELDQLLQSSWSGTVTGSMIDTHTWLHCTLPQGIIFKKGLISLLQLNSFLTSFELFDRWERAQKIKALPKRWAPVFWCNIFGLHSFNFTGFDQNSIVDVQRSVFQSCPPGKRPWGKPRRRWRDNISHSSRECLLSQEERENVIWKCKLLPLWRVLWSEKKKCMESKRYMYWWNFWSIYQLTKINWELFSIL